ncbi:DUF72 domain-containing protein [Pseudomonas sp. FP2196]|uniref:DUF72 domain-containing protein n=1 Tax=Pseudomonas sp. FP2196 TaxID=2954086 RepID=UPI00351FD077
MQNKDRSLRRLLHQIAQVAVDPSRISNDAVPGGWRGVKYWRLHGSPRIYHSAYDSAYLQQLTQTLQTETQDDAATWCVFDNTLSGAAIGNALMLRGLQLPIESD